MTQGQGTLKWHLSIMVPKRPTQRFYFKGNIILKVLNVGKIDVKKNKWTKNNLEKGDNSAMVLIRHQSKPYVEKGGARERGQATYNQLY